MLEAQAAAVLDPAQFVARSTLVSLLLDMGEVEEAEKHVNGLGGLAVDETQGHVVVHLTARLLFQRGDHEAAVARIRRQVDRGANLAASYGLLAQIRLAQFSSTADGRLATAEVLLRQAREAVEKCEAQPEHDAGVLGKLKERLKTIDGMGRGR